MIRIPITILALYLSLASLFAQPADSSTYKSRKLKVEEINFVTSYYHQDGNNAAVTGGIGSERLTDFATTFDIKLTRLDQKNRVNTYNFELGIDTYSSASSDKIDPSTISSASSNDQRFYPSLSWSRVDETKRTTTGANFSVSAEYDYLSFGGGINLFKDSRDASRQFGVRLQTFKDFVTMIYPIELRSGKKTGGMESRDTYAATFSISQIVNTRLQILFLLDIAHQSGFLSLPFNRVYFDDNSVGIENLPGNRLKYPASVRVNYFAGDIMVLRSFYRYYQDDWGLTSHTAELETAIKLTPFTSISPFYRYYRQTSIDYFSGFGNHKITDEFYTSDYDLSGFDSHFFGAGFRKISVNGILGIKKFNMVEIRYGHYSRQTGLVSDIISLNAKFK